MLTAKSPAPSQAQRWRRGGATLFQAWPHHSPLPLLLSLLGRERAVLGQWREVIPVVDREGLESPIRALGEDVVRGIFCHTALLYALEPAGSSRSRSV